MKDFMNEIPKETLTVQNIRDELKQGYKKTFGVVVLLSVVSALLLIMAINISKETSVKYLSFYYTWIMTGLVMLCTVCFIIWYIKAIVQLKQKITIVTDWLVDMREYTDLHSGFHHRHKYYTVFTFAKYGTFRLYTDIYGNTNYTWSKMYAMSNQGVCNYSNIDDEFYLVITNDKKPRILQIYNQKLFELK